jgi:hypothetical protein
LIYVKRGVVFVGEFCQKQNLNKMLILIGGFHSLFFVVFHCLFWSKLDWKNQLPRLSKTNSAVMQILNLRIISIAALHALMCFRYGNELLTTHLGNAILIGSSLFWIGRTIEQFVFYKFLPFKQPINIFVTALFIMGGVIYLIPLF